MNKILYILFGVLFMYSCDDGEILHEKAEGDLIIDKLISMGYEFEDIEEFDSFFMVEGDLMYSKDINDYQTPIEFRQVRTTYLVGQSANSYKCEVCLMKVYVDGSVTLNGIVDDWPIAVLSAINDWNSASDSKVYFEYTTNKDDADIVVKSDEGDLNSNVAASAGGPRFGKPYPVILINLDFIPGHTGPDNRRFLMVHELGHCIGFRHTDYIRDNNTNPLFIPGTPGENMNDPNSVMNSQTALNDWNGFSAYDIVALLYLYPPIVVAANEEVNRNSERNP